MADKRYTEAVGRRKTATARVRLTDAKTSSMTVNGKTAEEYFPLPGMVRVAFAPLQVLGVSYAVSARVRGGGHKAQAESIRLGISRAIVELVPEQRKDLKIRGFLKRDPRAKERKKFGLKAARRAPQWSKR
ncbi:30S ribosomal protein S9 [Candidatus Kaiserbacteria bacterium RIFCSPHIGHO2_01_FULL_54_36]|uniref:Small ribosomal subunit protein uS9 n=1 Tax=Candidatus Kaiserbacteria bacterium RIFCSPHIGHO2_01_FULL_54_36 TaxID=1798482 RepID=A0A1F6CKT2_9BACT|nr:MAG: 30S ribosomal protein S9 [Candidatus Kaiserbacteria bacterium RIFCSPHIGHO2_01_FULL_54_36]OGG75460.1 MAG: 30S ribosomal protein S9 [Candidatus Kaiserbacteria bacterium RIFCSPLOWO2_01_FULL_54_22]